jgi:hypothetical protein
MVVTLHTPSQTSLDEVREFLESNAAVVSTAPVLQSSISERSARSGSSTTTPSSAPTAAFCNAYLRKVTVPARHRPVRVADTAVCAARYLTAERLNRARYKLIKPSKSEKAA